MAKYPMKSILKLDRSHTIVASSLKFLPNPLLYETIQKLRKFLCF